MGGNSNLKAQKKIKINLFQSKKSWTLVEKLTVTVSPCPTLIMESPPSRLIASLNSRISFLVHILAAEMGEYSVSEKKYSEGDTILNVPEKKLSAF
jgi:hypothetical protein